MEAKDIMSDLQALVGKYFQDCNASNPPKPYLAMEIAEISFKAGIREVVEKIRTIYKDANDLKEKGIEEAK